jgi:hypothetical protein
MLQSIKCDMKTKYTLILIIQHIFCLSAFAESLRTEDFSQEMEGGEYRVKRTYRGDHLILLESWKGKRFSRIFSAEGHPVWGESDETGDGNTDTIHVFHNGKLVEAFTRQRGQNRIPPNGLWLRDLQIPGRFLAACHSGLRSGEIS